MWVECLQRHTNLHVCVYVRAWACIHLQARGKRSKFEGGAPQPLHKRSCSEWTMCTELHSRDWADRVFSLFGKVGYMCVCLDARICVNWLCHSDENGVHRRTKWYVFACLLLVCVYACVWRCWVAFSQCLLMCEMWPYWAVKNSSSTCSTNRKTLLYGPDEGHKLKSIGLTIKLCLFPLSMHLGSMWSKTPILLPY